MLSINGSLISGAFPISVWSRPARALNSSCIRTMNSSATSALLWVSRLSYRSAATDAMGAASKIPDMITNKYRRKRAGFFIT